jgi:hypothetical protein
LVLKFPKIELSFGAELQICFCCKTMWALICLRGILAAREKATQLIKNFGALKINWLNDELSSSWPCSLVQGCQMVCFQTITSKFG